MHPIKRQRAMRQWSLRELGQRSGVPAGTISGIERGTREPQVLTLAKIADALGVDVEELMVEHASPKANSRSPLEIAEEERRWAEDIKGLADFLEAADALWEKKLEDDVYDRAEVETARAFWNLLWGSYGERLTEERAQGRQGKPTLPDPVHAAYADALTSFGILSQTLTRAENNPRIHVEQEPADLRQRRSGEAG